MAVKVYNKRGNTSLKEKRMVEELTEKIKSLQEQNPDFTFDPANNASELESLYNKYCIDDADFEDVGDNSDVEEPSKSFAEKTKVESKDNSERYVDPFNRDEPIVRDYVLNEEFPDEANADITPNGGSYDEPRTFAESFEIPDAGGESAEPAEEPQSKKRFQGRGDDGGSSEPMNPDFDQMDSAKQRKKTKRFAKQIVSLTCDLLEKGFEWYCMKDITEAKLTEYEINDEMDLSILLDMPNGQQATVKEFFLSQHQVIRQESKIDPEDREDLIDALTEVFLEKGIAPTPMQELMLVGARVVGLQVIKAVSIVSSNNAVLGQLRQLKKEEVPYQNYEEPSYTPPPTADTTFQTPSGVNEQRGGDDFEKMFPVQPTIE